MEDDTATYEVAAVVRFTVSADGMSAAADEVSRRLDAVRSDPERPMQVTDVRIHRADPGLT